MDQTIVGIYWAYEGTPVWAPPPRLLNQVAAHIAALNGMNAATPTHHFAASNLFSCSFKPHRLGRVATPVRGQSLEHRLFLIEQINFLRARPAIAEPRAVENIAFQREGLDV